ncbi:MAG: flagellar FlbD family protein [Acidimicrobiales bacterium]|nr:flagellar FlbD family protein [Acidimicrobiales bacterium]
MIAITRLDGSTLVVNADLIETIERSGDTVVTLVSSTRFVVRESVEELIAAVVGFRAEVLLAAERYSQPAVVDRNPVPAASAEAAKVIPLGGPRRSDAD